MSEILQSLNCPQCGGCPLTDNGNGTISCPYCGSAFAHPERVCPQCETVNEVDARQCVSCGQKIKEPCVRCGTLNWVQAQHCQRCGAGLGVLENIAVRHAETTADRIVRMQAESTAIKAEAERSSQARLQTMWAKDNARLEALARSQIKRKHEERLIWMIATGMIVALLIVILVLTVLPLVLRAR